MRPANGSDEGLEDERREGPPSLAELRRRRRFAASTPRRAALGGRGQQVDERVEKRLHADARSAEACRRRGKICRPSTARAAARRCSCSCESVPFSKNSSISSLVGLGHHLDELVAPACAARRPSPPESRRSVVLAAAVAGKTWAFMRDQVDDAAEALSSPIGIWIGTISRPKRVWSVSSARSKDGALAVHAVDDDQAGELGLGGLRPRLSRSAPPRPRTASTTTSAASATRSAARASLREVRVAGRVDEVDLGLLPLAVGEAGREGDACGRSRRRRSRSPWSRRRPGRAG